jgi:UDP-glucose 4-epimerase
MASGVVLVTGATGAVGPRVVRACQAAGYSVRTLSRQPAAPGVLPPGVDVRLGDVGDQQEVRAAIAGADIVVHLAAMLHQLEQRAGLEREFERINLVGTENVVSASIAQGVRRVVFLSTIAVYGPTSDRLIDERTTPRPDTAYGRTKLAAEEVVLSAKSGGRAIGTVLRAAAIYGPRVKGNYRQLAVAIARRRYVPIGPGLNRRTLVHDRDVAAALVLAAAHPDAAGAVFNVSDGHVHTLRDIVAAIHHALGRRSPRIRVPGAAARAAAIVCEAVYRTAAQRPPLTRALLDKYTEDVAVEGTLIQRTLGFVPGITLAPGWHETMEALRDSGAWTNVARPARMGRGNLPC